MEKTLIEVVHKSTKKVVHSQVSSSDKPRSEADSLLSKWGEVSYTIRIGPYRPGEAPQRAF